MVYQLSKGRTMRLRVWYWGRRTYRRARKSGLGRFGIAMICMGVYLWMIALLAPILLEESIGRPTT